MATEFYYFESCGEGNPVRIMLPAIKVEFKDGRVLRDNLCTDVVKLYFFGINGRGESIRMLLAAAEVDFEDIRVNKEGWEKMKPTLKWPHLPVLQMEGKFYFQSLSICRHLARKFGLYGNNEDDMVLSDMTVEIMDSLRTKFVRYHYLRDSSIRDESLKLIVNKIIPFHWERFEDQLIENNGYLVGGKLTWADIVFLAFSDHMSYAVGQDLLEDFPRLKEHQRMIGKLPGIRLWMDCRPPQPRDLRDCFSSYDQCM